jgi:hypothetical protein
LCWLSARLRLAVAWWGESVSSACGPKQKDETQG